VATGIFVQRLILNEARCLANWLRTSEGVLFTCRRKQSRFTTLYASLNIWGLTKCKKKRSHCHIYHCQIAIQLDNIESWFHTIIWGFLLNYPL
jgi:hypothetical protein